LYAKVKYKYVIRNNKIFNLGQGHIVFQYFKSNFKLKINSVLL